jgi:hypothetical protein
MLKRVVFAIALAACASPDAAPDHDVGLRLASSEARQSRPRAHASPDFDYLYDAKAQRICASLRSSQCDIASASDGDCLQMAHHLAAQYPQDAACVLAAGPSQAAVQACHARYVTMHCGDAHRPVQDAGFR